jgi:hypothetical protein
MTTREWRVHEQEEAYLGPVAIAVFIDIGWIRRWPKAWTKVGLRAIRNGYGRWPAGGVSHLPYGTERIPGGAAYWPGRRVEIPKV